MFAPRYIAPERRLTNAQRVVVVALNVMLLAELTLAMYLCQQGPGDLTVIFLKTFLPLAAATLVAAKLILRRLRPAEQIPPPVQPGDQNPPMPLP